MKKNSNRSLMKWLTILCGIGLSGNGLAAMPLDQDNSQNNPPPGHNQSNNDKQSQKQFKHDEILVKLKPNSSIKSEDQIKKSLGAIKGKQLGKHKKSGQLKQWWKIKIPKGKNIDEMIEELSSNPDIEIAEPNYKITIDRTPNDPRFPDLWGMNNIGQSGGIADADIDATEAWDKTTSSSVIVAVIDTGMDYTHEDLAANMWTNSGEIPNNNIDDDGNGL